MKKVIYNIDGTRFGNHLYFYLYSEKNNFYVKYLDDMCYWNEFFPKLNTFISNDTNVFKITPPYDYYQNYHKYFSHLEVNNFIKNYLADDLKKLIVNNSFRYDLIINIRRGDFYSEDLINFYGFDVKKYVYDTINIIDINNIKTVGIISDDIEWCENNLDINNKLNLDVIYLRLDPIESFLEIIKARNIVITNSTFSYWASYINTYLYNDSIIYAPDFNTYFIDNGNQISSPGNWELIKVETYYKKTALFKLKIKNSIRKLKFLLKGKETK